MKRNLLVKGGITLFTSALLFSCGSDLDADVDVDIDATDSTETVEIINTDADQIEYSVPTPNELFDIIKDAGGELNIELVNSLDNEESYIDNKSKALNFGTYSADIGYMSCFDHSIEFLKYTKTIERIGDELGISEVFDQDLMDRIESNEGNNDSLFVISNDTYYDSYQYLEENEKGTELALIISGGFIESLYIVCHLAGEYSDDNKIVEKIGDQKLVLENILDFNMTYMDDPSVNDIMNDLMSLSETFENSMDFVEAESNIANDGDVAMLSSGGHFKMSAASLTAITDKVTEIRTKITQK